VIEFVAAAAAMAQQNQLQANCHLNSALRELEEN
jgi:hypothetical protein